jgi:hypothetical protein
MLRGMQLGQVERFFGKLPMGKQPEVLLPDVLEELRVRSQAASYRL